MRHDDTIAALATPAGTAAVALLRMSGPDTRDIVTALVGALPPARRARYLDYRTLDGSVLDDVLLTFFAGPHSYTGEDAAEISCHGNPYLAQRLLEDLFARGCRAATPGEFTQRAFLNGRMDLSQAEAVMDVIHARSERALAAAHRQLRGDLGRRMQGLVDRLLVVLARVEAYIDFPDEDLPIEDKALILKGLNELATETEQLLATSHYGELLRDGIKTVIIGAPNVGKSSLLNRLVGHERALVSPEPGTTRDFIEERLILGPHCLRVVDTAGLNPSPAPLERLGMAKTLERADLADLFLVMLDATAHSPSLPAEVAARVSAANCVVVMNKADLLPDPTPPVWAREGRFTVCIVSALTGSGLPRLAQAVVDKCDTFSSLVGEDGIAISARHAKALQEAKSSLAAAREKLEQQGPVELLASDLRTVLASYGEIIGKVDNERMLDQLFATFCIGK
ncbi:tRNA uridine-5-carboxymethylaminomethyl(34) synthesis GTPase MnmE [Opitutus sp. ER46]|uniref:tRNA uridine-5-carboxymethylaminomethyl(34) synthesis GTPase MnmE n=1 Tax=Opitutus sp. ER46 TaxID=2161864 RepID=UPI000D30B82E|nr:tRNA uridine-5-carboxymethylaminomethyl(34) synthesis GTPase MnmE [Opitutus sp. ER46]PTX98626.1 tRNA uridine-5-carboxymethylaminomethyl(34) synthesis GTPase MnmE [Opitutus sp. ER46]